MYSPHYLRTFSLLAPILRKPSLLSLRSLPERQPAGSFEKLSYVNPLRSTEELFVFIGYCRGTQGARCYTDDASLKPDESGHDQWRGYRVYPPHCHDQWGGGTSPTVYQWGG